MCVFYTQLFGTRSTMMSNVDFVKPTSHEGNGNEDSVLAHPSRGACHGSTVYQRAGRLNTRSIVPRGAGPRAFSSKLFGGALGKILMLLILTVSVRGVVDVTITKKDSGKVVNGVELKALLDRVFGKLQWTANCGGVVTINEEQRIFFNAWVEKCSGEDNNYNMTTNDTAPGLEDSKETEAGRDADNSFGSRRTNDATEVKVPPVQADRASNTQETAKEQDKTTASPTNGTVTNNINLRRKYTSGDLMQTMRSLAASNTLKDAALKEFLQTEELKNSHTPFCRKRQDAKIVKKIGKYVMAVLTRGDVGRESIHQEVDQIVRDNGFTMTVTNNQLYVPEETIEKVNTANCCGSCGLIDVTWTIDFKKWFDDLEFSRTKLRKMLEDREGSKTYTEESFTGNKDLGKKIQRDALYDDIFEKLTDIYTKKYDDDACFVPKYSRTCWDHENFNRECCGSCSMKGTLISSCVCLYGLCVAIVGGCLPTFIDWIQGNIDSNTEDNYPLTDNIINFTIGEDGNPELLGLAGRDHTDLDEEQLNDLIELRDLQKAGTSFQKMAEELGFDVPSINLTRVEDEYIHLIDSDNWSQLVAFVIALSIMSCVAVSCCIKKPFECDI